jgi:hypothetical protein
MIFGKFIPFTFYRNGLVMNTENVVGKTVAVRLKSISRVSAVNPLVLIYDIHGRQGEVLFFYSIPNTTRDLLKTLFLP